jgi:hypothetical protein
VGTVAVVRRSNLDVHGQDAYFPATESGLEFIMDRIETGSGIMERRDSLTV